jgi:hypothetical protein
VINKNSVNIGFQQDQNDTAKSTMMKTNNMHQIRETENEHEDYDATRNNLKMKKVTSGDRITNKQLVTDDGILRSSPSVDCIPGNKQGEEVFQVKSSAVAGEERKDSSMVDFTDARAV